MLQGVRPAVVRIAAPNTPKAPASAPRPATLAVAESRRTIPCRGAGRAGWTRIGISCAWADIGVAKRDIAGTRQQRRGGRLVYPTTAPAKQKGAHRGPCACSAEGDGEAAPGNMFEDGCRCGK